MVYVGLFTVVAGFRDFVGKIPNGNRIGNPCKPNELWHGLGHQNPDGNGDRNPFGTDFERFGKVWNRELCTADSDGDGSKNGDELGDPNCEWSPGSNVVLSAPSGHPGVCEPMWTEGCREKNKWMEPYCSPDRHCIRFNSEGSCLNCFHATMKEHSVQQSAEQIPYNLCKRFPLPKQGKLVGMRPLWRAESTKQVVKEIVVYGCPSAALTLSNTVSFDQPMRCNRQPPVACNVVLFRWKAEWGDLGYCLSGPYGYKLDAYTGFGYALVQAVIVPDQTSPVNMNLGVELYYDSDRPQDAATLTVGPSHVAIPPRRTSVSATGFCSEDCAKSTFTANLNVAAIDIQMNQLGREMYIEQWKDNQLISRILHQPSYSPNKPTLMTLEKPIEVAKDEEIRVSCTYDSRSKLSAVYGDTEKCEATLIYYPQQLDLLKTGLSRCVSYNEIDTCDVLDMKLNSRCNMEAFYVSPAAVTLFTDILEFCYEPVTATSDPHDKAPVCNNGCKETLEAAYRDMECLRGDMKYAFMDYLNGRQYLTAAEADAKLRFDGDVYRGMTVCHGQIPGDDLTVVAPKGTTITYENNHSGSSSNNLCGLFIALFIILQVV